MYFFEACYYVIAKVVLFCKKLSRQYPQIAKPSRLKYIIGFRVFCLQIIVYI